MQGVQETRRVFVLLSAVCLMGKCKATWKCKDEGTALKCYAEGSDLAAHSSICLSLDRPLALVLAPF